MSEISDKITAALSGQISAVDAMLDAPDAGRVIPSFDEPDWMESAVEEAQTVQEPATLERLALMTRRTDELEAEILAMTEQLAAKEAEKDKILCDLIPGIMDTLGLEEYTTVDGRKVKVSNDIKASINEANKPMAFQWLKECNYDGIIKTNVQLAFGKGEYEQALLAVQTLRDRGFSDVEIAESVHYQTLQAFVKERIADEVENEVKHKLPTDLFGVFERRIAKITKPRSKRK
jgi:hypothetical protein